ncbi:MAG: hypothetical protein ACK4NO_02765 [Glycocaulis sp.]
MASWEQVRGRIEALATDLDARAGWTGWPHGGGLHPYIIIALALLVTLNGAAFSPIWMPQIISADLDPSWMAVFNALAFSDTDFAHGLVYTYGPLGFLPAQLYWPDTYALQIIWWMVLAASIGWGFFALSFTARPVFALVGALGLCVFAFLVTDRDAWMLAGLAGPAFGAALGAGPRVRAVSAVFFVAIASVMGLTKFTFFLCALGMAVALDFARWQAYRAWPVLTAAWLVSTLILWTLLGQDPLQFFAFVGSRLEISSGYAEILALTGPTSEIVLFLLCCMALAALLFIGLDNTSWPARLGVIVLCAVLLYIAAGTGFIRQEYRLSASETFLIVGGLGAAALLARNRALYALAGAGLIVSAVLLHAGAMALRPEHNMGQRMASLIQQAPARAGRAAEILGGRSALPRRHEAAMRRIRRDYRFPRLEGTVDYLGLRNAVVLAHGYEWGARPIFQDYQAYNRALNRRNGDFYASDAAPDHILAELMQFSGAPGMLLDSESYAQLLARYRHVRTRRGVSLYTRCETPSALTRTELASTTLRWGETYELPDTITGPVWMETDIEVSPLGRLAGAFFKRPSNYLFARLSDGTEAGYRAGPSSLGAGFLLSPRIDTQQQLSAASRRGLDSLMAERQVETVRFEAAPPFVSLLYGRIQVRLYSFELEPGRCT